MKTKNIAIFFLAALAVAASSCSKTEISGQTSEKGTGTLTLGVSLPQTKAALSSDELLNTAKVNIYMGDFSGLVREYVYSEAPETIYLPADEYRVDVIAGEAAKTAPTVASWEQKSYKGSKNFTVSAGKDTQVQVVASVSNAVSKIAFDASVAENFEAGYTFTIGLGSDASLVYDAAKSGSEGYFIIDGLDEPELVWTFSGKLAKDGSTFTKSGSIPSVEAGKVYSMNVKYTVKDGEVGFDLLFDYATEIVDDTVVFEPVSTGLSASSIYEIWAGHATVHADVDEVEFSDPSAIKFAYRAEGASDWTTADAVRSSEGVYDAVLKDLKPSTKYEYKLVIAGADQGDAMTFITEAAPNVPNASFEYVSKISGKSYYKWYDPNCDAEEGRAMFWGSGNGEGSEGVNGSANMNIIITEPSDDAKDGSRSVCAMSKSAVGMLAAGNIFTGQFAGLVGTSGGKVNFGRPWTSRPTGIRLWVKYSGGDVNIITDLPEGADFKKGYKDRASVKIALGTWSHRTYGGTKDSPVLVNTTDASTFVDYRTDASTIADGELILYGEGRQQINGGQVEENVAVGEWRQVTIPFSYHRLTEYPTHIIISCASSMYGDYFSGSDSSRFWIDGVELLYE